jgi:hypothetical protein
VIATLGEKLQPVLHYLSTEVNEPFVNFFERDPALLLQFLVASLTAETDDTSSLLFFRLLKNALPEGADNKKAMGMIADSLVRKAPEHRERFAEAIILVVSFLSLYFFVFCGRTASIDHSSHTFVIFVTLKVQNKKSSSDCGQFK